MTDEDALTHWFNATGRMRERAEAAEAERDQLRESVRLANTAAEAAAEAVGNMAEKCSTLMAERDRLRVVVTDTWCALFAADRVGDEVELLSTEHAAMIPDTVRSTMVASNEVLRAVEAERDRMQDELEAGLAQWVKEANHAARRIGECNRERDRLRAVVAVADDFWPLIESIYDQALSSWEHADERMKYVTVQISKVDLPTLHAAYAPREVTDG